MFTELCGVDDLTERQREILNFIQKHQAVKGYWPSIREVQARFRFKSTNAVVGHLRALEAKGAVTRVPGQARAFRVVSEDRGVAETDEVVEIPILGEIAAGYPDLVESGDAVDRLQIDLSSVRRGGAARRVFALRVRGESMIDAGINDGDTVVFDPRPPRDGDIVVALIDGASTLKRYIQPHREPPFLRSENRAFPEMHPITELTVQGVATALVRRL